MKEISLEEFMAEQEAQKTRVPKVLHQLKIDVTDTWLADCSEYVRMFTGIRLTPEQTLAIFLKDDCLLAESVLNEFATEERERFQDLLSQQLLGESWGDFDDQLLEAAEEAGYEVD